MDGRTAAPAMVEANSSRAPRRRALRYAPVLLILTGLALAYATGWHSYLTLDFLGEKRSELLAFASANPIAAPLGFMVVYALAVAFSFPAASILTIFAGFLFGWLEGAALVVVAATVGATAVFLAARSAFGDVLERRIGNRAARLAEGFEHNAFSYLLALRLAPVFPFFVVNIAPAFFNVSTRTFVAATFLGILPGTIAYAYLGQGVDSVLKAAEAAGRHVSVGELVTPQITISFIALALVAIVPAIVRNLLGRRG